MSRRQGILPTPETQVPTSGRICWPTPGLPGRFPRILPCTLYAGGVKTAQQWFNPCAYQTPASGTLGNAGRNILEDQTYWDLDSSIFRIFPITERVNLKADLEAFNALNHPVLGTPGSATTTSSTLGVITSTASTARILQGSVRFQF